MKEFLKFLQDNNCLAEFILNLHDDDAGTNIIDFIENYEKDVLVGAAFPWDETPEGVSFWLGISNLWLDKIEDGKKNY